MKPARILYVEDNPQNMRLVRKILTAAGYEVLDASTGYAGIALAAREQPDLILLDLSLPDINGLDAAARMKEIPHLAWIPVIALTANSADGDRERCLSAGCNGYLAKPVMKNELLHTIAAFLSQMATVAQAG